MAALTTIPDELDWYVYANSLNKELFRFKQGTDPWPLVGATIYAQAKLLRTDTVPLITATVDIEDAANGEFYVGWLGSEIDDLLGTEDEVLRAVWDLKVLEAGAPTIEPVPILTGAWIAQLDVSR